MSTQAGTKQAGRAAWGHAVIEVGCWLIGLATAALCYCLGGTTSLGSVLDGKVLGQIWKRQGDGHFDSPLAAWWLLITAVLVCVGFAVPRRLVRDMLPAPRATLVAALGVLTGVLGVAFCFARVAWLGWILALILGATVSAVVVHVPQLHRKPWRTAGISAGVALFVLFVAQLLKGPGDAALALPWLVLAGGVVLIAASVAVYITGTPARSQLPEPTGVVPTRGAGGVRAPMAVRVPWACHALTALLAGTFVLALPAVTENGFGMAGYALVVCGVLIGWAAGYEVGPTFAPGMTRPRLTAFAVLGAGVMEIGVGILTELSGIAVLSALVAFCVGVGLRAQDYGARRRYGFGAGTVLALVLAAVLPPATVRFNADFVWHVAPSMNAHLVFGVLGIIAGIVALFAFSPQGIRGISVDVLHAFTPVPDADGRAGEGRADGPDGGAAPGTAGEEPTTVLASDSQDAPTTVLGGPAQDAPAEPSADVGVTGPHREPADGAPVVLRMPSVRRPAAGAFITFEGIDGSGKTTQLRLLAQHLKEHGLTDVVTTREPGGTPAGKQIRHVVQGGSPVDPRSEALLYAADRAHHIASLVEPALERGAVVLGDRYIDSSIAYQAAGRQLADDDVRAISRWATTGLLPQLTVLIDTDLEAASRRTEGRGEENHLDLESSDFKGRVRETFLGLAAANPDRYVVIDGARSVDEVAAAVAAAVDPVVAALVPGYHAEAPYDDGELDSRLDAAMTGVEDADADVEYSDVDDEIADDADEAATRVFRAEDGGPGAGDQAAEDDDTPEFLRERASQIETNPILDREDPFTRPAGSRPPGDEQGRRREQPSENEPPARSGQAAAPEPDSGPESAAAGGEESAQPAGPTPEQRHQQELERLRAQAEIERTARQRLREARLRRQRGDK